MTDSPSRTVLITGAAGFVGRRQADILIERGHEVVAFIHSSPLSERPSLRVVRGDIRDQSSIAVALQGVDAVIHLAAAKNDEKNSKEINVGGTANLVAACRDKGVARLIYVSTQADPRGVYGRTKYEGERVALESGLDVTVLRPNLIYGADKTGAFAKIAQSVCKMPIIPITGPARGKFWPIHVDDVCTATAACVESDKTIGKTYVLAGPDAATLPELIRMVGDAIGKRPGMIHLPRWFSLFAAQICAFLLPENPPLTVSNVLGCNQEGVDSDTAPARRDLDIDPRPLAEGLKQVMEALQADE